MTGTFAIEHNSQTNVDILMIDLSKIDNNQRMGLEQIGFLCHQTDFERRCANAIPLEEGRQRSLKRLEEKWKEVYGG